MLGTIVRFIVSALVLLLVGYLLPGITVSGFVGALIAAVVIAVLGYIVEAILGDRISPRSRGIVGFITAAVVIYVAQYYSQLSIRIPARQLAGSFRNRSGGCIYSHRITLNGYKKRKHPLLL